MKKKENNIFLAGNTKLDTNLILFHIRDFCFLMYSQYSLGVHINHPNDLLIELELFKDGSIGVYVRNKSLDDKITMGQMLHELKLFNVEHNNKNQEQENIFHKYEQ